MNFYFCETCGKRITEKDIDAGAGRNKKFAGVFCAGCAQGVMTMETLALNDDDVRRMQQEQKLGPTPAHGVKTGLSRAGVPAHAKSTRQAPMPEKSAPQGLSNRMMMGIAAGVGVLLALVAVFMTRGSPATPQAIARDKKTEAVKPAVSEPMKEPAAALPAKAVVAPAPKPVETTKAAAPVETARGTPPEEDPREAFAARRLAELKALEAKGETHAFHLRKQYEEFVQSYGRTNSGKEAAEHLKTLPVVEAPLAPAKVETPAAPKAETRAPAATASVATGETKILFHTNFDADDDFQIWASGDKEADKPMGGSGASLKFKPWDNGYFTARANFDAKKLKTPLVVGENTWVRFACKIEGSSKICLQFGFATDDLFEFWFRGLPQNKWQYLTFSLKDFNRNIRGNNKLPVVGSNFRGGTMMSGEKKPCTVLIDNFTYGEGPIPEAPEIKQ